MWVRSFYQVTFYNSFFEIFEFKVAKPIKVSYDILNSNKEQYIINYEYQVSGKIYKKTVAGDKHSMENRIGVPIDDITIYYNSLNPHASFIKGWKLDSYYLLTFFIFSFFLILIYVIDRKVDKEEWIVNYRKAILGK